MACEREVLKFKMIISSSFLKIKAMTGCSMYGKEERIQ